MTGGRKGTRVYLWLPQAPKEVARRTGQRLDTRRAGRLPFSAAESCLRAASVTINFLFEPCSAPLLTPLELPSVNHNTHTPAVPIAIHHTHTYGGAGEVAGRTNRTQHGRAARELGNGRTHYLSLDITIGPHPLPIRPALSVRSTEHYHTYRELELGSFAHPFWNCRVLTIPHTHQRCP